MIRSLSLLVPLILVLATPPTQAGGGAEAVLVDQHWLAHKADSTETMDHSLWSGLLKRHVVAGKDGINRVRYAALATDAKATLDIYVAQLEATDVTRFNRAEQKAFWINLYNAVTIKVVAENYPVSSIRKVLSGGIFSPGPWKRDLVTIEGRALSLDDIEHGILRPIWQDNRIHYAVNCASIGCPNIANRPYTGETVEAMLDQAARAYVNHSRGAEVKDGKLSVSRIFDWYDADFGGNEAGVIAHLKRYADPGLKEQLAEINRIRRYGYDWALNDADEEAP